MVSLLFPDNENCFPVAVGAQRRCAPTLAYQGIFLEISNHTKILVFLLNPLEPHYLSLPCLCRGTARRAPTLAVRKFLSLTRSSQNQHSSFPLLDTGFIIQIEHNIYNYSFLSFLIYFQDETTDSSKIVTKYMTFRYCSHFLLPV